MRPIQKLIVAEFGVSPEIDPAREIDDRVRFLADYLVRSGATGYILGISGGLDSTLAGRLAQLAVEKVRTDGGTATFVAVRLPYRVQHDEADAQAALDFVAADETITYNVGPAVDAFEAEYAEAVGVELTDFTKGNTKARLRMVAQYAVGGDRHLLVIGTDHGSESVTGFFTKFGDGAADILPLFGLNKRQNRQLLRELGAPEQLWAKVPTADLLDDAAGQPDETELGLSYEHIDAYVEGREVPDDAAERIEQIWWRTRHKRTAPVDIFDTWWKEDMPQGDTDALPTGGGGEVALVVIDMQNSYFELPGVGELKDNVVPPVNELIRAASEAGRPVILVRTQHERDKSTWTINMLEDDQGFAFPGTDQARFVDELETPPHVEIVKTRDSAFHRTDLDDELRRLGVTDLLLCGISTHSCVAETATDAFANDFHVAIAGDAVASENPPLAEARLAFLRAEMRQSVLAQKESLGLLSK